MKILVVDDHALVREGLCQVLQGLVAGESTEILQAANCRLALALVKANPDLDLVLLDYHLPDMDGLAALALLGKRQPDLPVVILSGSANVGVMQRALAQGAAGFITKSGLSEELLSALRQVLAGQVYRPRQFDVSGFTEPSAEPAQFPVLTPRQEDVLKLLLEGASNRDISERLHLADETVKSHISNLLHQLGVKSRTQAMVEARRWGYGKSGFMPL